MYFHQLLLETTEKVYFSEVKEILEKTHEKYGKWLFGQYSEAADADEELAAEICYQLLKGSSFDLLVEYMKQKHVISLFFIGVLTVIMKRHSLINLILKIS